MNAKLHIQAPKLDNLRKHLINGKCPELIQPFIRRIGNTLRIRMFRHDVADILEQFQRKRIQSRVFRIILINALLQVMKILVDIPVEPIPL